MVGSKRPLWRVNDPPINGRRNRCPSTPVRTRARRGGVGRPGFHTEKVYNMFIMVRLGASNRAANHIILNDKISTAKSEAPKKAPKGISLAFGLSISVVPRATQRGHSAQIICTARTPADGPGYSSLASCIVQDLNRDAPPHNLVCRTKSVCASRLAQPTGQRLAAGPRCKCLPNDARKGI